MPAIPLIIIFAFLFGGCAAGLGYWLLAASRVIRVMRDRPTVRKGLACADQTTHSPGSVSVIVPAHNEEAVIDACARSLRAQRYESLELIFVLDRCTDRTKAILEAHAAADARIRIIENDVCPDDWAGKCHAARLGAEVAGGAWLLFTDADTVFDPDLVKATVALANAHELGLLSLLSTLTLHHAFERIIQPVASMTLIRMYPIERVNPRDPAQARPFANGQFMLFARAVYEQIGGHAAVHNDLLEDIALARRLHAAGGRCGVFLADGMLRCSMYDSLDAFIAGWKRIYIEACKRKPGRLRKNAWGILTNGVGVTLAQIGGIIFGAGLLWTGHNWLGGALLLVTLLGIAVQYATLGQVYALGGTPRRHAMYYPIGAWMVARIMLAAARDLTNRAPIRWGGKEYTLEPRA